ncbi:MAG: hypothetical protein OXP66_07505 [Candidatus Tectomicrobia bacterium]|nr:hypothetical protein [Candidatus Tectomicrobia bacterium]
MEATAHSHNRFGRPMDRERDGHGGGGQLFVLRREGDFERGLLSEKGHGGNFLTFKPAEMFMRMLGDDVLQLNEALFEFRGRAVEHVMVLDDEGLQEHYGELNRRFEAIRDRLMTLTDYCNKGFAGQFEEACGAAAAWEGEGSGGGDEEAQSAKAFGPSGPDVYEAVRRRNVEEGVLTEAGSEQGYVALQSCPFYGRVIGEIIYTFNDALRRLEGRTPQYIAGGQVESVRRYYVGLMRGMKPLRGEVAEAVRFCRARVG